jgi:ankyrin repeat protein
VIRWPTHRESGSDDIPLLAADTGETPLTCAAYCGHYDAVRALVEDGGADVNMTRQDGTTPLNLAAYADAKVCSRVCEHRSPGFF